jgi:hypothetical protein
MDHTPLYCSIHASHIEEELNGRLDDEDVLDPNRVRTPLSSIGSLPDSDDSVRRCNIPTTYSDSNRDTDFEKW